MAAMPIYGKNPLKIFFSGTSGTIFNKTLYAASGTTAHQNLLKLLPWVDLDFFFVKVKICNLGFYCSCRIRTLVTMATYSSHRLMMGTVEIDNFCCLIEDI